MSAQVTNLTFPNGAERLVGRLRVPSGGGPWPAVILVHGLGASGETMESAARDLVRKDVAALTFDQRGHGRSSGIYTGDSSEDILAAAALLEGRDEIDPSQIAVMGHSSGVREAILACLKSPRLTALVCTSATGDTVSGPHDREDAFYRRVMSRSAETVYPRDGALPWLHGRLLRTTSRTWSWLRGYHLRVNWAETLDRWARLRSSMAVVDMAPRPALFLHCAGDRTAPPVVSEILYQKASGPKELMLIPRGWHAAPLTQGRIRQAWTSWLAEQLSVSEASHGISRH